MSQEQISMVYIPALRQSLLKKRTMLRQLIDAWLLSRPVFLGLFHHLPGHHLRVVAFQHTLNLHQETVNDTDVASSNPYNSQSFLIRKIIHTHMHARATPALFEEPPGFFLRE
jgi:hypothetical protein